jgi:peptidoglycan/LPS O-acetylase OafA/YrhL
MNYETKLAKLLSDTLTKLLFKEDVFASKKNNWGLIRLIAAFAVIYGHSFGMFNNIDSKDWTIDHLTMGTTYSGQMAVVVFFFISGALVTRSLVTSRNAFEYILKRVSRVAPGLILCLLISGLVIAPLFGTNVSLGNILSYINGNIWLVTNSFYIEGVFTNNRYKAVNGSLWTLPNEMRLYFVLFIFGLIFAKITREKIVGLLLVLLFFLYFSPAMIPLIGSNNELMGNGLFVINSIFFVLGGLAWAIHLGRIRGELYLLGSILVYVYFRFNPERHLFIFFSLVAFCMFIASFKPLNSFVPKHDYSYGVYLYGWVTGQIVVSLYPRLNWEFSLFLNLCLSLLFAAFSWHIVEKPTLNFVKGQLSKRIQ